MKGIKDDNRELTPESLAGMQSVRTTFNLTLKSFNLLSVAARQLGIKQKALLY